jgi:DNA-binding NarL/FixJ family response regulator
MEASLENNPNKPIHVLLVGNNPIELSTITGFLRNNSGTRFISEIAFDLRSLFSRIGKFKPNYILIDDNIGRHDLKRLVHKLHGSARTKDIPIAILKNSNYTEALNSVDVQDYLLKNTISSESLSRSILNGLKFKNTRAFLYKSLKKGKKRLLNLFSAD